MTQTVEQAWEILAADWQRLQSQHLRDMFDDDPNRFDGFSFSLDDLTIDFSKERIDADALAHLLDLARAADVEENRDAMFAGKHINTTEDRAVLHVALRGSPDDGYQADGQATADLVDPVLNTFLKFADDIRAGKVTNVKGLAFTDVINIGIGGSDLGPVMATRAMSKFSDEGPNVYFVSKFAYQYRE